MPEPYIIKMPQLSDTMTEGVVVSWEKKIGDRIQRGDTVATIETDKAIMDVEVFREGYLSGPITPVDSVVPVGAPIAYLVNSAVKARPENWQETAEIKDEAVSGKDIAGISRLEPHDRLATTHPAADRNTLQAHALPTLPDPAPRPVNKNATPYARKLAALLHINLDGLRGTGIGGTITASNVESAHPVERPSEVEPQIPAHVMPEIQVPGHGRPMTAMERSVSHSMTAALTMPTFRVMVRVQPGALIKAAKKKGVSVTVAIAKACALAIKQHPTVNWAYQPVDKLVERDHVDIGMAVAAKGGGLVVPVLRHCESHSLEELAESWAELVERARKRRLAPDQYANPTFMISNMGMLGVDYFDAIPTPGTCAVLAISATDALGMPLTITADHRVVNGAEIALYLNTLKNIMERSTEWIGPLGPAIPDGDWDYDVVVIGGGPGGEDCARELATNGVKVAMINDSPFPGGECLWRGCIPSKTWRAAADRIRDRAHDAPLGVQNTTDPKLDWDVLERMRRNLLAKRGAMALQTDKGIKIKVIQGFASFVTDHRLFIETTGNTDDPYRRATVGDGSQGEHITFGCAVIATGAPPLVPPIPGIKQGLESGGVVTSDTVWGLPGVPGRLGIIGGGAIGVEMAQIFRDFGSEVTLLEGQPGILAEVEMEIAKQLTSILAEDSGLNIHTSVKVNKIAGSPGAMEIAYQDVDDLHKTLECDYLLMATGKRPLLDALQLEMAGVQADRSMIVVDEHCRTNVTHIFAAGDVIGGLMLAHTAAQQGRVAAATILGEDMRYDQTRDCGVIFTRPQAAFVGLTLAQAKAKNIDAVEVKMPLSIDAKAMINGETHGLIKMVVDKGNQQIIGVHFLADHADTLVGEGVMVVAGKMTLVQVAQAIHPHPTQTEMFGEMARRLLSRLRRSAAKAVSNKVN